jgi:nucleotide-binding universal stress UspA family protein
MRSEIVVGLDDSPSSELALKWAARQAMTTDAVLRAVHVSDRPYRPSSADPEHQPNAVDSTPEDLQEDSYRHEITALFQGVSPRPNWDLEFLSGNAGEVLVRESEDAQLLVVGTREHVRLGRLLAGSVSHYCLSHAVCPVVAVPMPADEDFVRSAEAGEPEPTAATGAPGTESVADKESEVKASRAGLVVAGVDGSGESLAAARYAAAAAEMRGYDLLLINVFAPPPSLPAREMVAALSASRAAAEELLATVVAQLQISPRLQVHTLVEPGDATAVLEVVARQGEMLVLGRDDVSWGERIFRGAVTAQVARRVACPLVVVPRGWHTGHVGKQAPVVVALDGETSADSALSVAFREARLRKTRLILLHARPIGRSARDVVAAGFDLAVLLANWKEDHPEVTVSTVMVSGDPDAQLVRWSRSAAVLVIGRPHQRMWGSWVRSVAGSVMRHTHCPLIIAPRTPIPAQGGKASATAALI